MGIIAKEIVVVNKPTPVKEEAPKQQEKPTLAVKRNINTVYSDKIDVSKPSKYTEHFLKKE